MKRKHIVILFSLVSLMTTSCNKMDMLFNNGVPVTEHRDVDHRFEVIQTYNNVNVRLVQSDRPRLELTCPENLIGNIVTKVEGDTLYIKNENQYNWLRRYDYDIDLTVYYDSLREISYASTARLECSDPLKGYHLPDSTGQLGPSTFILRVKEGAGDINLNFNCQVMKLVFSNGTSKVTLHGNVGYTEYYLKSYGVVHAEALCSNIVKVLSHSTNDIYVWAKTLLHAELYSIGNVYYKGNPRIEKNCQGEGQIFKLE